MTVVTPKEISDAWHSVTDTWFVRRNKARKSKQWEVVHDWGGDMVSEETQSVWRRFDIPANAERYAAECENTARAYAVLGWLESGKD